MRILGVTETCDLGALYLALVREGHEVRVAISEPLAQGTLAGLVAHVADWRAELDWVGRDGLVVFEAVSEGFGAIQDELRRAGYRVVGGSAMGDRLENERGFAQTRLGALGLTVASTRGFDGPAAAAAYVAANPARYVLKFDGADHDSATTYVGRLDDGGDIAAMLAGCPAHSRPVLMDHIDGVEVGVGAFFDGQHFVTPACLDWEHKHFFAGGMGELTGEMGTVATFVGADALFAATLARTAPLLAGTGHVGWVNLNLIVDAAGTIWPLEFTCRFGYPGFAVLAPLQAIGWGELLGGLCDRTLPALPVHPGFSAGIVMTTPPLPYTRKQVAAPVGLPVLIDEADRDHLHFGEVGLADGQLVTSGLYGWTMVVTGTGATIAAAREAAYARAGRVVIPNARYRLDIGAGTDADLTRLRTLGLA